MIATHFLIRPRPYDHPDATRLVRALFDEHSHTIEIKKMYTVPTHEGIQRGDVRPGAESGEGEGESHLHRAVHRVADLMIAADVPAHAQNPAAVLGESHEVLFEHDGQTRHLEDQGPRTGPPGQDHAVTVLDVQVVADPGEGTHSRVRLLSLGTRERATPDQGDR
nr:hypothetical protein [Streptosporangium amethystogenes]